MSQKQVQEQLQQFDFSQFTTEGHFYQRLNSSVPLLSKTLNSLFNVYHNVKEFNPSLKKGFQTAEDTLATVTQHPVVLPYEIKILKTADHYGCQGLDKLSVGLDQAKQTVESKKEFVVQKYEANKDLATQKLESNKELITQKYQANKDYYAEKLHSQKETLHQLQQTYLEKFSGFTLNLLLGSEKFLYRNAPPTFQTKKFLEEEKQEEENSVKTVAQRIGSFLKGGLLETKEQLQQKPAPTLKELGSFLATQTFEGAKTTFGYIHRLEFVQKTEEKAQNFYAERVSPRLPLFVHRGIDVLSDKFASLSEKYFSATTIDVQLSSQQMNSSSSSSSSNFQELKQIEKKEHNQTQDDAEDVDKEENQDEDKSENQDEDKSENQDDTDIDDALEQEETFVSEQE